MNYGKTKTKVHFIRFKVQKSGRGEGRIEKKKWRGEDVEGGWREKESSADYSCGSVVGEEVDDSGTNSEDTCWRCNDCLVLFVLMRIVKCCRRWRRVSMALGIGICR